MSVQNQTKLQEAKEYWQDKWQKTTSRNIRYKLENVKDKEKNLEICQMRKKHFTYRGTEIRSHLTSHQPCKQEKSGVKY